MNASTPSDAQKHSAAAQEAGIQKTLLESLSKATALPVGENGEVEEIDTDYSDKAINALVSIMSKAGQSDIENAFTQDQRTQLKELLLELEKDGRIPTDLSKEEWSSFEKAVGKA